MKKHRVMITGVTEQDKNFLIKKSKKLGLTISGLVKEIIRKEREKTEGKGA